MTQSLSEFISPEEMEQVYTDINDNLTSLEESLLQLETEPEDKERINTVFRAMHSIKGIAGMFGLDRIAEFTHHIEDVYDLVRKGKISMDKELISLTLTARDQIFDLANNDGANIEKAELKQVQTAFHALLTSTDKADLDEVSNEPEDASTENSENTEESLYWIRFRFDLNKRIFDYATSPIPYLKGLKRLGKCQIIPQFDLLPELAQLDVSICYLYWDVALITVHNELDIHSEFLFIEDDLTELSIKKSPEDLDDGDWRIGRILLDRGDVSVAVLEESLQQQKTSRYAEPIGTLLTEKTPTIKTPVMTAIAGQKLVKNRKNQQTREHEVSSIRVPSAKLDLLVNQVGELVIAQARLKQLVTPMKEAYALQGVSEEITLLTENLRDSTMGIRMLPIGTLFKKFNRLVRDLSGELHKTITLETSGGETELDKTVIEHLNDPLVHLIRNSIDHGIETPEQRKAVEKKTGGTVFLAANHSGADVVIRVSDDGHGLNPITLRAKAIEKGLITEEQILSDKEIFQLIFTPGFSTKAEVSNLSGRGVGMDVVKKHIESLRGTIQIESILGQGCTITIKLPLTLAIIDGFLVQSEGERFVIPLTTVRECVRLTQEEIAKAHGEQIINIRNEIVPYVRLRDLFKLGDKQPTKEQVVITESDNNRVGLVVDQVLGQSQVVIKSLGTVFRNVPLFSGATILGDGEVVPILDIGKILEQVMD